jgi:hypothetical protein
MLEKMCTCEKIGTEVFKNSNFQKKKNGFRKQIKDPPSCRSKKGSKKPRNAQEN